MTEVVFVSVVVALITSFVYCRFSAAYTFHVIDGYVKDMVELTKESIRDFQKKNSATSTNYPT